MPNPTGKNQYSGGGKKSGGAKKGTFHHGAKSANSSNSGTRRVPGSGSGAGIRPIAAKKKRK